MANNWIVVLIVCITVSSIVSTWIRAKHGYPLERSKRRGRRGIDPDSVQSLVDEALHDRDERIATLEERVRVLERIVTDKAYRLRDEIDRLAS